MRHAMRGVVTAWLALIALQTIGTSGSGRVASLFADLDDLANRALSPDVPAIPDLAHGEHWGAGGYRRPADLPVPAPSPFPTQLGRIGATSVYAQ